MRKCIFLFLTGLVIIAACHKKSVPVITARTSEPEAPKTETINSAPDAEAGKIVFSVRCHRCHGLPEPNQYTEKRWETILALMGPGARLTKGELQDVMAYVKANAKTN